jgi:twitching motility two-component system response regulator PilH
MTIVQVQGTAPFNAPHPALLMAGFDDQTARTGARGGVGAVKAGSGVRRVMVVDDSIVDRTNLITIIEQIGHQVIAASSGAEAVQLAQSEAPDLIFLDIMLGEMDGFKTCRTLHRDPQTANIPVVMVSSKKNKSDMVWAAEQGARAYIVKPYTAQDIITALEQFT